MSGWILRNDINTEPIKIWDDFNYTCFTVITKTSQWNKRLGARFLIYNFAWQPQVQGIFLDAFTKLRRLTISFAMSSCVCLSDCLQLSAHPSKCNESFHENCYLSIFRISAEKILISRKYDKNNGYFTWRCTYIYEIPWWILLRMINVQRL
jgi:hypothetical protein